MAPNQNRQNGRTKLLDKQHTGRLRPHHHTSYGSLLLMLLLVLGPLMLVSRSAFAVNNSYQPQSYGVSAVVPSPVPTTAPTITSIQNGQTFSSSDPVTISGTCPGSYQVDIFKNQVMAGSVVCKNGSYSLPIDLFVGSNSIFAQAFNADNIGGPQSPAISVTLLTAGTVLQGGGQYNTAGTPANQFYVAAVNYVQGGKAGKTISWNLIINGGTAPYTLEIGWGDGKTDSLLQTVAGKFTISHEYTTAPSRGSFPITVKAVDQAGQASYLQLEAVVGNQLSGLSALLGIGWLASGAMRLAWGLLLLAIVAVISFWIGERREIHLLKARLQQPAI